MYTGSKQLAKQYGTFRRLERVHRNKTAEQVKGLDFAQQMLADAERRQQSKQATSSRKHPRIEWVQGDALELPFPGKDLTHIHKLTISLPSW